MKCAELRRVSFCLVGWIGDLSKISHLWKSGYNELNLPGGSMPPYDIGTERAADLVALGR